MSVIGVTCVVWNLSYTNRDENQNDTHKRVEAEDDEEVCADSWH